MIDLIHNVALWLRTLRWPWPWLMTWVLPSLWLSLKSLPPTKGLPTQECRSTSMWTSEVHIVCDNVARFTRSLRMNEDSPNPDCIHTVNHKPRSASELSTVFEEATLTQRDFQRVLTCNAMRTFVHLKMQCQRSAIFTAYQHTMLFAYICYMCIRALML